MRTSVIAYIRLRPTNATPTIAQDIATAKYRLNGLANFFDVAITDFYVEQPLPNVTHFEQRPKIQQLMARLESEQNSDSLLVEEITDLAPWTSDRNRFIDFFKKSQGCFLYCGSGYSSGYIRTDKISDRQLLERLRVN